MMELNLSIRKARIDDTETITSFNIAMAKETEGKDLEYDTIHNGVKNLFDNPHYGFYIVAEAENRIVGCLLITFEWSDWRNGLVWWIQSVYIHPDFRRRGIYRQMYTYIKTMALSEKTTRGFRLYVEKENRVAQNTYKNLGMEETVYRMFEEMLV